MTTALQVSGRRVSGEEAAPARASTWRRFRRTQLGRDLADWCWITGFHVALLLLAIAADNLRGPLAMSRTTALVLYVATCAVSALLWAFGKTVQGWAP